MMKNGLLILALFCLISGINACKKDTTTEIAQENPCAYASEFTPVYDNTLNQDGLIPLSFNNFWVYADTLWSADSTVISTSVDTLRIGSLRQTDGDFWWELIGPFPIRNVHVFDHKIYSLETGLSGCKSKNLCFYEATTDTITDSFITGDMAKPREIYKIDVTVSTPAGHFDDCTIFDYSFSTRYEILKPGIGFIKSGYGNVNGYFREYTLISYHIN